MWREARAWASMPWLSGSAYVHAQGSGASVSWGVSVSFEVEGVSGCVISAGAVFGCVSLSLVSDSCVGICDGAVAGSVPSSCIPGFAPPQAVSNSRTAMMHTADRILRIFSFTRIIILQCCGEQQTAFIPAV